MKQSITKLIAVLLVVSILPIHFSFAASNEKQYIKVGLAYGSGAVSSAAVKSEDGLMLAKIVSGGVEEILSLPDCKQLNVNIQSGSIIARDSSGEMVYDAFDADICIVPLDFVDGGILKYNDKPYRGGLCFYKTGNEKLNVINYIELENYIYGVLNSEMGYSNPMEALKAQAVTARSFAVSNMDKHKSDGFDFCTTAHCQVYKGYEDEYAQTNRAADETAGLVLTYDGKPVSGYYFKNSGGHTQSSADVWGGTVPYLIGVKDEYSPNYPWTYQTTFQELSSKLQAAGHHVGRVESIAIKSRNASGAVSTVEIKGTSGTAELKNDSFRSLLGSVNVLSMMFSFSDSESIATAGSDNDIVHVIGADGKVEQMAMRDVYIFSNGTSIRLSNEISDNQERLDIVTKEPLVINGMGYGHGVGMPQDSAMAMARQGFTYEEILKYYYTGIKIQ